MFRRGLDSSSSLLGKSPGSPTPAIGALFRFFVAGAGSLFPLAAFRADFRSGGIGSEERPFSL